MSDIVSPALSADISQMAYDIKVLQAELAATTGVLAHLISVLQAKEAEGLDGPEQLVKDVVAEYPALESNLEPGIAAPDTSGMTGGTNKATVDSIISRMTDLGFYS